MERWGDGRIRDVCGLFEMVLGGLGDAEVWKGFGVVRGGEGRWWSDGMYAYVVLGYSHHGGW